MAKIKDIRKWGFPAGAANESTNNPFLPILKRMLKAIGVGYKDPCCPDEEGTCQDPCGYIQTISTDDMSTISISGLNGAPGNTIDLKKLVDYSETVTKITDFSIVNDPEGRPNILSLKYKDEDGVENSFSVDLGELLPDLMIQSGSYDATTNVVTLVTYDGSQITFTINELTGFNVPGQPDTRLTKANKQVIGTFHDENEQNTDIYETVTSASLSGNVLTIINEDGSQAPIDFSNITPNCCIASAGYVDTTGVLTLTRVDGSTITTVVSPKYTYALDAATDELVITSPDGSVVKLDLSGLTPDCCIASVSDVDPATGNITFTRADGSTFTSKVDTLTSLTFDGSGNLIYVDEKGVSNSIDISGLSADCCINGGNYNQSTGEVTFTTLGGGSVGPIKTESLTSLSFAGTSLSYVDERGTTNSIDLSGLLGAATTNSLTNPSGANITSNVNGVASTLDITNAVKAAETNIAVADTNSAANKKEIATVTNEDGVVTSIKETVTSFSAVADNAAGTLTLTFVDENGVSNSSVIDICALIAACTPASTVHNVGYHPSDASTACNDAP